MGNEEKGFTVAFDDEAIKCARPDGLVESVRWDDIVKVTIEATAGEIKEAPDHVWIIWGRDNRSGCVYPGDAEGVELLLVEMQNRLSEFDIGALGKALKSDENQTWLLWSSGEGVRS
jgi:hypothetical protein